jgi:hypothetical protein
MFAMEQHNLCWTQECLGHCFQMRVQLPLERNAAYLLGFSSVRNITSPSSIHLNVANSCIQVNGRCTLSPGRKPSMLEEGWSSILFPCEN